MSREVCLTCNRSDLSIQQPWVGLNVRCHLEVLCNVYKDLLLRSPSTQTSAMLKLPLAFWKYVLN